jgi:(2Fe-2S) ferredoxin
MTASNIDPAPYFKAHVFCCTNQRAADDPRGCCQASGGVKLRNYFKKQAKMAGLDGVRVNVSGCLDRCEFGPVLVIYPEGVWYKMTNEADVDEIIERHLQKGERVERLILQPDEVAPEGA